MPALGENLLTVVLILLLVAIVVVYLRWSQKNVRASAERIKKYQFPPDKEEPAGHNLDAPASAARWEIQMHDLARDLLGQLDTKIAILNGLLLTAEQHIARLERAIERSQSPPQGSQVLKSSGEQVSGDE